MKKNLIIYLCLFCCVAVANAQQKTAHWYYPILPGSEEWSRFTTHSQMLEACQIPKDVLEQLSTEELVFICIDYPLQTDFYAYNNLLEGVNKVASRFNGLQELLNRKDNGVHLLKEYHKIDRANLSTSSAKNLAGEAIVKQSILEILLSLDSVLDNINDQQRSLLVNLSMSNLNTKINAKEHFSKYSIESSAFLLARMLQVDENNLKSTYSSSYHTLIEKGSIVDNKVLEELENNYKIITK